MEATVRFHVGIWDYVTFVAIFVIVVGALAAQYSAAVSRLGRIASMFLVVSALGCLPAQGRAAGLDCPGTGAGAVSTLLTELQVKLVASGNSVDLANEIDDLINKLQIDRPNISYGELTDILIAAYCPVVANLSTLTASEKWRRMRQFDAILQRQLDANLMPAGSLIIARVPLPPAVYRELRSQAASSNQTPAQLMTAILSRAAGQ